MGVSLEFAFIERGCERADSISAEMITRISGFRILTLIGGIIFGRCAEAVIVAGVLFVLSQIQNVAVGTIPVVKVGPVLEPVRIETSIFLIEAADGIGAAQKSARTRAHQAMVLGDMAGFGLAAKYHCLMST